MHAEGRDYAILISILTREEAEVMASSLRADGIDAFVGNTSHLGMNWHYTLALGGLQIFVPRNRLEDARAAVRHRLAEFADADLEDRVSRRDRWKVWLIAAWYLGPTIVGLTIWFAGIFLNAWDGTGWLGPGVERETLGSERNIWQRCRSADRLSADTGWRALSALLEPPHCSVGGGREAVYRLF